MRANKYQKLTAAAFISTNWQTLQPQAPFYLFSPQNENLRDEYEQGWKITDIMLVNSVGIATARDDLTIQWDKDAVWQTVTDFSIIGVEEAREKYALGKDARNWKVAMAQADLNASGPEKQNTMPILYRPFDIRHTYYTGKSRGFDCMPRGEVMRHFVTNQNYGFGISRSIETNRGWEHVIATKYLLTHHLVFYKGS